MTRRSRLAGKEAVMRDIAILGPLNQRVRGLAGSDYRTSTWARWRADGGCNDPVGVACGGERARVVVRGGRASRGLSWRVVMANVAVMAPVAGTGFGVDATRPWVHRGCGWAEPGPHPQSAGADQGNVPRPYGR